MLSSPGDVIGLLFILENDPVKKVSGQGFEAQV